MYGYDRFDKNSSFMVLWWDIVAFFLLSGVVLVLLIVKMCYPDSVADYNFMYSSGSSRNVPIWSTILNFDSPSYE